MHYKYCSRRRHTRCTIIKSYNFLFNIFIIIQIFYPSISTHWILVGVDRDNQIIAYLSCFCHFVTFFICISMLILEILSLLTIVGAQHEVIAEQMKYSDFCCFLYSINDLHYHQVPQAFNFQDITESVCINLFSQSHSVLSAYPCRDPA